jgi:tetratricopeptide (TPR) repeat protein
MWIAHVIATASHMAWRGVQWRIYAWLVTRQWLCLLQASPAIVFGGTICTMLVYQSNREDTQTLVRYRNAAAAALNAEDIEAAVVFTQRLSQLDPTGTETLLNLARIAIHQREFDRARTILTRLTDGNGKAEPEAHFLLVNVTLAERQNLTLAEAKGLEQHLKQALRSPSRRSTAGVLLAELLVARKQWAEAIPYLEAARTLRPELRISLAIALAATGQRTRAQHELEQTISELRENAESRPEDAGVRIMWSRAAALAGDHAQAESVLLTGIRESEDTRLKEALADLYVHMSDRLASQEGELGNRLKLLEQALRYRPDHPVVLARLGQFADDSSEVGRQALDVLNDLLARGQAPATIHLILGTSAAQAERWDAARLHLEQASQLNPETPALLNNLAWVLASATPPQLDRALRLANAAIDVDPTHPEMRETRGVILARQQRWNEALPDLERALVALPGRASLHRTLADVYSQLGDETLAAKHERLADECISSSND